MTSSNPEDPSKRPAGDENAGERAVDDVIEFFTAEGDEDSPASGADAPPPG